MTNTTKHRGLPIGPCTAPARRPSQKAPNKKKREQKNNKSNKLQLLQQYKLNKLHPLKKQIVRNK